MKKALTAILMCVTLSLSSAAYAIIEAGGYGGYSVSGNLHRDVETKYDYSMDGFQYGGYVHLTIGLAPWFLGFGAWYHGSTFTLDTPGGEVDFIKHSWGPDIILQLGIPTTDLALFGRFGISLADTYITKDGGQRESKANIISTGLLAFGLAYKIITPLWLTLEYMYVSSYYSRVNETIAQNHAINLGAKVSI